MQKIIKTEYNILTIKEKRKRLKVLHVFISDNVSA